MAAKIIEAYFVYTQDCENDKKEELRMAVFSEFEAQCQINKLNDDCYFELIEYDRVRVIKNNKVCGIEYRKECRTVYSIWYEKKELIMT